MDTNYYARVVKITNLSPIEGADRIVKTSINTAWFIVGTNVTVGDLMVMFPAGAQLGINYATQNDCVRRKDENGNNAGGLFDDNRKVRAVKLRGVKSEGYLAPVDTLNYLGDTSTLRDGDVIGTWNDEVVCSRFYPKRTGSPRSGNNKLSVKKVVEGFFEHYDTAQLRYGEKSIKSGSYIVCTLKIHGSSGRTHVRNETSTVIKRKWYGKKYTIQTTNRLVYTGSRKVILDETSGGGWYGDNTFRYNTTALFSDHMHEGETIYGEIVGYLDGTSTPIMGKVSTAINGKDFVKQWGKEMLYKYGCPEGTSQFYVYRITQRAGERFVELSWNQVKRRCSELDLKHVPEYEIPGYGTQFIFDGNFEKLNETVYANNSGSDPIDPSHIREGVVIRVDSVDGSTEFFKAKSYEFLSMETNHDVPEIDEDVQADAADQT